MNARATRPVQEPAAGFKGFAGRVRSRAGTASTPGPMAPRRRVAGVCVWGGGRALLRGVSDAMIYEDRRRAY